MEALPNGSSADYSVAEQRASFLSVRQLAEKLKKELNFDRASFASGVPYRAERQPDCPKNRPSSSLPDPSPPSTPSPLCHPIVHRYADADSTSAASPSALQIPPPPPPPPPPPAPPLPPRPTTNTLPTRRLPAIYAKVYSSPSSSPSSPAVIHDYQCSLSSSPSPSHRPRTHPSPKTSSPAPGFSSHLHHPSQSDLNSLGFEDEAELKQTPDAVLDRGEASSPVAEQDEELAATVATIATSRVRSCEQDGGGGDAEPSQYSGGEARDFIMDRFLPAARAVAGGDTPDASSNTFVVNVSGPVPRRRRSSSLVEPNIADDLVLDSYNSDAKANVTLAHHISAKTNGPKARAAPRPRPDDAARKRGIFKTCGLLCLGLKTGVIHGCRRPVSSSRSVSVSAPKNEAISPRYVGDLSEAKRKTIPEAVGISSESNAGQLPSQTADVVQLDIFTSLEDEDTNVRDVKTVTSPYGCNERTEPSPASSIFSGSPKHASFKGSSPTFPASAKNSSPEYPTSSRGSPVSEKPKTRFVDSPVHSEIDSEVDDSPQFYDASSKFGSQPSTPVHPSSVGKGIPTSEADEAEVFSQRPQDWVNDEATCDDGIFSSFETPHTSESDDRSLRSESDGSEEGWFSPESIGRKSSRLSQRVGKVLRVDTSANLGMQEMNGLNARLPGQGNSADHSFRTELEHLRKGSFSRVLVAPVSTNNSGYKVASKAGLVSPVLSAKCQNRRAGGVSERKPPDGMGWPLGISSYHPDSALKPSREKETSNFQCVQGADVPVPPLPPAPSASWLKKAITSESSKSSPSSKYRSGKKKLQLSSTDTLRMRWESMVKSSNVRPGPFRLSEEFLHQRPG